MQNLHWQKSHFHPFIFDLNLSRGLAFLYLLCREVALNTSLFPYRTWQFSYFLCSFLENSDVVCVAAKLKMRIHYWRCYTVHNFVYFCHKTCNYLWWIVISFYSLSICWKSLVSSLCVNLRPFSWNLFIKLFDCLEQNIQTKGQ